MWQPSGGAHTTSSENPGSSQAVVDRASLSSCEHGGEVLLLCRPSSGTLVPAATMARAEGERTWLVFDRESSTLFTGERKQEVSSHPTAPSVKHQSSATREAARVPQSMSSATHNTWVSSRRTSLTTRSMLIIGLKYRAQ